MSIDKLFAKAWYEEVEPSRLHCETDAAWEAFCKCPSDSTWQNYSDAKRREDEADRASGAQQKGEE